MANTKAINKFLGLTSKDGTTALRNLEKLGNKILLEKRINIRASDYRFVDKKKFYLGYTDKNGKEISGTDILELHQLAELKNFAESDIVERNEKIFSEFINYLESNNLLK